LFTTSIGGQSAAYAVSAREICPQRNHQPVAGDLLCNNSWG
jgi:hypothetical protein